MTVATLPAAPVNVPVPVQPVTVKWLALLPPVRLATSIELSATLPCVQSSGTTTLLDSYTPYPSFHGGVYIAGAN
jgi:hypothetical protein